MSSTSEQSHKRLGEILVDMKCLSPDQLAQALEVQSRPGEARRVGEILISRGFVKCHHVKVALAKQNGSS